MPIGHENIEFALKFVANPNEFNQPFWMEWLDREKQLKGMYGQDYKKKAHLIALSAPSMQVIVDYVIANVSTLNEGLIECDRIYNPDTRMFETGFVGFTKQKIKTFFELQEQRFQKLMENVKVVKQTPIDDTHRRTKTAPRR